ncbi:hypothetical protein Ancab_010535 [Ancistrocladus abbreviatus]
MEALRYANVKGQKKMWQKIYNGFADKSRRDYDDLISCRQHKLGLLSFDPHQTAGRKNNYPGILSMCFRAFLDVVFCAWKEVGVGVCGEETKWSFRGWVGLGFSRYVIKKVQDLHLWHNLA